MSDDCKHGREICLTCAHERGVAEGRRLEREAVAALLRYGTKSSIESADFADAIERGDHLPEAVDEAERADIATAVIEKVDAYMVESYGAAALDGRPSLRLVIRVAAMVASLTLDVRERMKNEMGST